MMWFFRVPEFYFGEDALSRLEMLAGRRAFIVSDPTIQALGFVQQVENLMDQAGFSTAVFSEVEPNPTLQTIRRGAAAMKAFAPDWIIGLGGGSCMDAAKAMWILYERPDIEPEAINPFEELGLRQKARLVCIPTTAGTGSESNYALVLTDTEEKRKLTLGAREATPDLAIIDPAFTAELPAPITADTGIDILTHAIEGYTSTWANDFTDGLCLQAARLVKTYLPRAVASGKEDMDAREKMGNAAAIAGMVLGNSQVALAHALSHSAGPLFTELAHGRLTAIFLPPTIEFVANAGCGRYQDLANILELSASAENEAGQVLADWIRCFLREVGLPVSLQEAGLSRTVFETAVPLIVEHTDMDPNTLCSRRIPESGESEKLLAAAYSGSRVHF